MERKVMLSLGEKPWVVFDIGGVLVTLAIQETINTLEETYPGSENVLSPHLREEFTGDPKDYSLTEKAVCGMLTGSAYRAALADTLPFDISDDDVKMFLNRILSGVDDRVAKIITGLRARGIKVAALTNVDETHWDYLCEKFGVDTLFDVCICSYQAGKVKPTPAIYAAAADALETTPASLLFFDDRPDNVSAARAQGWHAIQYTDPSRLRSELRAFGMDPMGVEVGWNGNFEVHAIERIFESRWMVLTNHSVTLPGGANGAYAVSDIRDGVAVLPMPDEKTVVLAREHRYALGCDSLEVFSGAIDPGESVWEAAARELGEEAYLQAAEWRACGPVHPLPSSVVSATHLFIATGLSNAPAAGTGEPIDVIEMPLEHAVDLVLNGTITHATSQALILRAQAIKDAGKRG